MTDRPVGAAAAPVEPISGLRLVVWAAIAVAFVNILFFTGASNFEASPQARILNQVLFVAAALALGGAALRGRADLRSPLVVPILLWTAAMTIATLASQRPATSREALGLLLIAAPAYLVVRAITWTPWLRPRIARLVVGSTVVLLVAYVVQAGLQWVSWWSVAGPSVPPLRPGDVGLTIGTVNAVALYMELLVPLAAWIAWRELGRRWLALSILVLGTVALVITASRGAWLGSAAAVGVVGLLAWWRAGRPLPRSAIRKQPLLAAVVAVGIAVVSVGALAVLAPRLLAGDAGRLELWRAAADLIASSPVTGTGPGTYPLLRPLAPVSQPNLAVLTTSHNSILQVLTDGGVLLLGAGLVVIAVVARLVIRSLRDERGFDLPVLAVTASLVAVLVHSVVDPQFHIPAVVMLLFVLVARLDPPALSPDPRSARVPVAVGGVLVAVGVVVMVPIDVAMFRAQLGNQALDRGDAAAAATDFAAAIGLHDLAPYRLGAGIAASRLGDEEAARVAFAHAAATHPLPFLKASEAAFASGAERSALLDAVEANGSWDAAALLNTAAQRFSEDPDAATRDLATVMAAVPSLIPSTRPEGAFDNATWAEAQRSAISRLDPITATWAATLSGMPDVAGENRSQVSEGPVAEALDLLIDHETTGALDLQRAVGLLRAAPASQPLLGVLWQLGFAAESQALLDAVAAVSVPMYFGVPSAPLEVVVDGDTDARSWQLQRWPMASDFRNAPARPYAAGMLTIEPVYRLD